MEALITLEFVGETVGDFVGQLEVRSELNVLTLSVSAKVVPSVEAGDAPTTKPRSTQQRAAHASE